MEHKLSDGLVQQVVPADAREQASVAALEAALRHIIEAKAILRLYGNQLYWKAHHLESRVRARTDAKRSRAATGGNDQDHRSDEAQPH